MSCLRLTSRSPPNLFLPNLRSPPVKSYFGFCLCDRPLYPYVTASAYVCVTNTSLEYFDFDQQVRILQHRVAGAANQIPRHDELPAVLAEGGPDLRRELDQASVQVNHLVRFPCANWPCTLIGQSVRLLHGGITLDMCAYIQLVCQLPSVPPTLWWQAHDTATNNPLRCVLPRIE